MDANFAGWSDDSAIPVRDACPNILVLLSQVSEHIQVLSTRVMDASFAGRSDDPAVPVQSYWYFDTGE